MSVTIKSRTEIDKMRESCRRLEDVFLHLERMIAPGVSTWEINQEGERLIRSCGGTPNFLHYSGYPASICTSVNDEVVHGIPSRERILQEGDIISLDAGLILDGYHSDMARTIGVGRISQEAQRLIDITRQSFFEGMKFARAGCHLHEISAAIGTYAQNNGCGVVRELCGHGIGTSLHEDPMIPNMPVPSKGIRLYPRMTLAVEPMLTAGRPDIRWLPDHWTVVTKDHSLAAHYENTIVITDGDPEILTLTEGTDQEKQCS